MFMFMFIKIKKADFTELENISANSEKIIKDLIKEYE